jgi:L-alanine-DL-glutamate epimerase-like enolase superfamily enzyme
MKPEETAKETEVALKKGFTNQKLKARPWDIVRQCELISQVGGPEFGITVDPNMTFETLGATIRISRQLEKYNILCLEDPISWANWNQFRLLRQKQDIPIAPHLGKPSDVLNALKAEAADLFNVGGSFANIQRCAALADAAGLPIRFQVGGLTAGIAGAWDAHVGAAIENATLPNDLHFFLREHDLLVDSPLGPVDGCVAVPEMPGLGVELDEKMLEKYRTG